MGYTFVANDHDWAGEVIRPSLAERLAERLAAQGCHVRPVQDAGRSLGCARGAVPDAMLLPAISACSGADAPAAFRRRPHRVPAVVSPNALLSLAAVERPGATAGIAGCAAGPLH